MKKNKVYLAPFALCICFLVSMSASVLRATDTRHSVSSLPILNINNDCSQSYYMIPAEVIQKRISEYKVSNIPGFHDILSTCNFMWKDYNVEDSAGFGLHWGYVRLLRNSGRELEWKIRFENLSFMDIGDPFKKKGREIIDTLPYKVILELRLIGTSYSIIQPFFYNTRKSNKVGNPSLKYKEMTEILTPDLLSVYLSLHNGHKYQATLDLGSFLHDYTVSVGCCRLEITIIDSEINIKKVECSENPIPDYLFPEELFSGLQVK